MDHKYKIKDKKPQKTIEKNKLEYFYEPDTHYIFYGYFSTINFRILFIQLKIYYIEIISTGCDKIFCTGFGVKIVPNMQSKKGKFLMFFEEKL